MRLGVCLTPDCCQFTHRIVTIKATEKFSTEAKEFNPFTGQMAQVAQKEFRPEVQYSELMSPVYGEEEE